MKEMTSEELAVFNGKDGRPVYVAYQGKVYDVTKSRLWSTGSHMKRHPSGKDLTGEISAAPHGPEVLERYPQVAALKAGAPEELKHLPPWLQDMLQRFPSAKRHPHPMIVHFPLALLMAGSLFILLSFMLSNPSFELTSFYLLILGTIASPFALTTGFFTWWINYMLKPNPLIKRKIQLSFLLLGLEVLLMVWRGLCPALSSRQIHPLYFILMLILAPLVGLIGYYGGQLTFPSEKQ
jgi:predicted heme/steroid binding protein/uncharacterized membrane protein